ncbi:lipopolysaccharide biosynthesis protein [Methylotetracoccus oryzae]|uniref:lipopolysaccharide biosynthesis protein n=1 Tax=Methylotetracoccus oryzae TaxID=1919059 RepID=UPI0013A58283|nr:lipopolysaccharide biosynthesis protein [Methylotetracoccus oryzae]
MLRFIDAAVHADKVVAVALCVPWVAICWVLFAGWLDTGLLPVSKTPGLFVALMGSALFIALSRFRGLTAHRFGFLGALLPGGVAVWFGATAWYSGSVPTATLLWAFALPMLHFLASVLPRGFRADGCGSCLPHPWYLSVQLGHSRKTRARVLIGTSTILGAVGVLLSASFIPSGWSGIAFAMLAFGYLLAVACSKRRSTESSSAERMEVKPSPASAPSPRSSQALIAPDVLGEAQVPATERGANVKDEARNQHHTVLHALKWSFLGELASKAVGPAVFVVLARLLTPEDYGVVAAATMVISFSQIFWEAGMGKAIIQYQGDRQSAASAAFWINNGCGILVAAALVAGSDVIAEGIFHDARVASVLKVMAIQVFLAASISVHVALLQKDMQFKHLFWVRFVTVALPGLTSVPLAWYGFGYWSLVAGSIAGQALQVTLIWLTSPWRPSMQFNTQAAYRLTRFGGWVAATALLAWVYSWADSLIVGRYFGPHDLGLFRTGNAFVSMIYGLVFGPVMPVVYAYFSGVQRSIERVQSDLFRVIKLITLLAIPIALILCANAFFIADFTFGAKWYGVAEVISVLALMHGYSWVVGANGEAYRALGVPANETKIMAVMVLFYAIGYLLSVRHGFSVFLWTRLALALGALTIHFWVAKVVLSIQIIPTIRYMLKISILCLPAVLFALIFTFREPIINGIVGLASGIAITFLLIFLSETKVLAQVLEAFARKKRTA